MSLSEANASPGGHSTPDDAAIPFTSETLLRLLEPSSGTDSAPPDVPSGQTRLLPLEDLFLRLPLRELPPISLGPAEPVADSMLDLRQQDAVRRAASTPDFLILNGPPGTGKSRTLIAAARAQTRKGHKVLYLTENPTAIANRFSDVITVVDIPDTGDPRIPFARRQVNATLDLCDSSSHQLDRVRELFHRLADHDTVAIPEPDPGVILERVRRSFADGTIAPEFRELWTKLVPDPLLSNLTNTDIESARERVRQAEMTIAQIRARMLIQDTRRWWKFWSRKTDEPSPGQLDDAERDLKVALDDLELRQKLAAQAANEPAELEAARSRLIEEATAIQVAEANAGVEVLRTQHRAKRQEFVRQLLATGYPENPAAELQAEADRIEATRKLAQEYRTALDSGTARFPVELTPLTILSLSAPLPDGNIDLLIIDDAHHFPAATLKALSGKTTRCLLAGEAPLFPPKRHGTRPVEEHWFPLLWRACYYPRWSRDAASRLVCRLRRIEGSQRKQLQNEPVADQPDVELRIHTSSDGTTEVAEVVFPENHDPAKAREFIARELESLTVMPETHCADWSESPERISVRFALSQAISHARHDGGIHEELSGLSTSAIHFDRTADWTREAAQSWIESNLTHVDSTRGILLQKPHRACAGLARWLNAAFGCGYDCESPSPHEPNVEFLAVPDVQPKRRDNPPPADKNPDRSGPRAGGAGYEIDLADPRHRSAIAPELAAELPAKGYVNPHEANALLKHLESIEGPIAVGALYGPQLILLRKLASKSSRLGHVRFIDCDRLGELECETVVICLTRSHVSRAVSFGESPAIVQRLAMGARRKILFVGDPGTLSRRLEWSGPLDHFEAADAAREKQWIQALSDCPRANVPQPRRERSRS